jgi:hypothetical protein
MENVFNEMRLRGSRINFLRPDVLFHLDFGGIELENGVAELRHIFGRLQDQLKRRRREWIE